MTNIRKLSELHLGYSYIFPKNGHHVAFIGFFAALIRLHLLQILQSIILQQRRFRGLGLWLWGLGLWLHQPTALASAHAFRQGLVAFQKDILHLHLCFGCIVTLKLFGPFQLRPRFGGSSQLLPFMMFGPVGCERKLQKYEYNLIQPFLVGLILFLIDSGADNKRVPFGLQDSWKCWFVCWWLMVYRLFSPIYLPPGNSHDWLENFNHSEKVSPITIKN